MNWINSYTPDVSEEMERLFKTYHNTKLEIENVYATVKTTHATEVILKAACIHGVSVYDILSLVQRDPLALLNKHDNDRDL